MPDSACTCPAAWQGTGERPLCPVHERHKARRRDGTVVNVLASAGCFPAQREAGTWSTDVTHLSGIRRYA